MLLFCVDILTPWWAIEYVFKDPRKVNHPRWQSTMLQIITKYLTFFKYKDKIVKSSRIWDNFKISVQCTKGLKCFNKVTYNRNLCVIYQNVYHFILYFICLWITSRIQSNCYRLVKSINSKPNRVKYFYTNLLNYFIFIIDTEY